MVGESGSKTIYIGQIPNDEVGAATRAAGEVGFVISSTVGPGDYSKQQFGLEGSEEIKVDPGNTGILLTYPDGNDAAKFWEKFFEIKEGRHVSKETEHN